MAELNIYSPYDGRHIETVEMHSASDAAQMIDSAVEVFKDRKQWLEREERVNVLYRLLSLIEDEQNTFAQLIALEGGKPLIDARVEVARAIDGIALAIEDLPALFQPQEIPMGRTASSLAKKAVTTCEPIGVVVAISAFNHPLNLIIHQVIPVIAVGCPVIVKPALATPLNCIKLVELLHQAGLPPKWCQLCIGDNKVAEQLAVSSRIAFLSFIGSASVGWSLRSKLAPGVRCALEHGGVAPVIIDKTADLDKAIPSLVKGGFYHAGQVCVSVQRVYVHRAIMDELTIRLKEAVEQLQLGDPSLESTEVGPLISLREVERVDSWVKEAIKEGAELITGGKKLSNTVYVPTVLRNPPINAKISTQEIFGPVVALYVYDDIDDVLAQSNDLDFAFQAAIYTEDKKVAEHCIEIFDATAVMVNEHTAFRVDWMPFAGRRLSGYGIGGIGYTMRDMVQLKMVITQL